MTSDELVSTVRLLLRRRAREGDGRAAAALAEVGRQIARPSTEPGALHRILGTIRELFGARRVVLYERGGDGALKPVALAGDADVTAGDAGEAVVSAPLVAYGEEIGVLALAAPPGRVLATGESQLFATFADICALAAHNARLYATSQRALDQTQLLLSVVGGSRSRPVFTESVQRGTPLVCPDVRNDPRLDHPLVRKMALTPSALVALPVAGDRGTRGVLVCYWWTAPHDVAPHELRLAVGITEQLARALEHLRLADEAERHRREAEFIADLAAKINASLHLDEVLQRVTQGARELCRSDLALRHRAERADHDRRDRRRHAGRRQPRRAGVRRARRGRARASRVACRHRAPEREPLPGLGGTLARGRGGVRRASADTVRAAAVAEDGRARPPVRRHRARLQQPADGDRRPRGAHPAPRRLQLGLAAGRRADRGDRGPRDGAHAPAARVQPPPGHGAARARRERRRPRPLADAHAAHRRAGRDDAPHGARHRRRHGSRDAGADLRSVLHHEDAGAGYRPRPLDGLRRGATERRRRSPRSRPSCAAAARRSCSSRTIRTCAGSCATSSKSSATTCSKRKDRRPRTRCCSSVTVPSISC
ncbi:MAG: GAF domain-containing protein [Candidatus Rokubacteria bacterium]|nr:GAF domain-containing protein [Candidatus Rokubacteria bacterium]